MIAALALLTVQPAFADSVAEMSSGAKKRGADGYVFKGAEYNKSQVIVDVVYFDTQKELDEAYKAMDVKKAVTSSAPKAAFSIITKSKNTCTIYMVKPTISKYRPEFVGHEFLHCIMGEFH